MSETPAPYAARPEAPAFTPSPIRYKLWDGDKMHSPEEVDSYVYCNGEWFSDWRDFEDGISITDPVALLSTGLHDSDGVEVFEGDLLQDLNEHDGATATVMIGWCPNHHGEYGPHAVYADGYRDSGLRLALDSSEFAYWRVVGSVYTGRTG